MHYSADLHIHSCLSPCGSLEMSPLRIVNEAEERGINIIAIADHNSAKNCPAFHAICNKRGIAHVFGVEATSMEEAHILCLFDTLDTVMDFDNFLYSSLPDIPNNPERFGDQVYVDEYEQIEGEVEKYLNSALDLSIDTIKDEVIKRNGLYIPAHIDKPMFSIPAQLGFLPEDNYSAIEISREQELKSAKGYPVITNSDAHYPEDIGKKYTNINVEEFNWPNFCAAIMQGKTTPVFSQRFKH